MYKNISVKIFYKSVLTMQKSFEYIVVRQHFFAIMHSIEKGDVKRKLEEKNLEINLLDIYQLLKTKIAWILAVALVAGVCGFVFSSFMITPKYEASVDMIVNSKTVQNDSATGDQFTAASKMAANFTRLIRNDIVLKPVIESLGLDISYNELKRMVSAELVSGTTIMNIKVTCDDSETARKIVEKISEIAPPILVEMMEVGSCKNASGVNAPQSPVSPNVKQITFIAFVLGAVACAGIIIVADLMDNTFRTEQDIRNEIDVPVLGVLPSVESCIAGAAAAAAERKGKKV